MNDLAIDGVILVEKHHEEIHINQLAKVLRGVPFKNLAVVVAKSHPQDQYQGAV